MQAVIRICKGEAESLYFAIRSVTSGVSRRAPAAPSESNPSLVDANVLVVDDDPLVRRLFIDVMEDEGYAVRGACNGREAIEECERQLPDLLLLDLMMPVLDGYAVLEEIDLRGMASFPVVLVTGNANITSGLSDRISDTLRKPVDLDDLCQAATHALDIGRQRGIRPACTLTSASGSGTHAPRRERARAPYVAGFAVLLPPPVTRCGRSCGSARQTN